MLSNNRIKLRAVEPEDVDYLFKAENNVALWKVSETVIPFSKNTLAQYASSVHDIVKQGQFRFIIEARDNYLPVGMLDLFDYTPIHKRAGIGIVITDESHRNNGIATEALELIIGYAKDVLQLKQLHCSMHESNELSRRLFEKLGFKKAGERRYWYKSDSGWETEVLYQLILT